jgi:hypothetical protein
MEIKTKKFVPAVFYEATRDAYRIEALTTAVRICISLPAVVMSAVHGSAVQLAELYS